ncbi:uncharacterized protein CANTADRAFT_24864 [Suhomyces tanzawaensis NRRL Y-17324]|uniref:Homeobox domain-containing protein n=1 Tax=Suhomyces tanzawaensis NRRL Y-17324 TaxID=984487 RepID=A0A1E4SS06_9ASCO|nr:uncharacterized protein CANTADRAFT_24864 [Suhomyces tanzawaensis NRRL Y-17324]ODV82290.1 hypothetical protein CANTADRAFT_24864 [Suhomyces tanzawaensis NRRL Y-17324]
MSNRNKINLPPISDILLNHPQGPVPVGSASPLAAGAYAPSRPAQSPPVLPPLSRQNSHLPLPMPQPQAAAHQYKYYDYYYGNSSQVPYPQPNYYNTPPYTGGQYYAPPYGARPAQSLSFAPKQPVMAANATPSGHILARSPLSNNASPVYTNDVTPPPLSLRHSYKGVPSAKMTSPSEEDDQDDDSSARSDSDSSPSSSSVLHGGSKRKTRNNLPKETTYILLKWLNDHLNHPYPNSFEKNQLMISTGLNQQQLSNWFINARRRKIKSLKEQRRLNLV